MEESHILIRMQYVENQRVCMVQQVFLKNKIARYLGEKPLE